MEAAFVFLTFICRQLKWC